METNTTMKVDTVGELIGNIKNPRKKSALDLVDDIDRNIRQTQAIIEVVTANTIKDCTAYQTFNDETIATLLWQVDLNLEALHKLVDDQWEAVKRERH